LHEKKGAYQETGDQKIRTGYREKYTMGPMPAYEHTVFGSGSKEQKTIQKNAYKPHVGV
jgi:hypothetical protein